MHNQLNRSAFSIALAGAWGITIVLFGLISHFTGEIPGIIQAVDRLYPGSGTGPRGILIALIFGIAHGAITGWLIATIYNLYLVEHKDHQ
ncbi:hypothetical protein OAT84_02515 [Gammaproteobacteria bacterium]|nr:hypothetical protein [Gammaproteobacteria bacterium]